MKLTLQHIKGYLDTNLQGLDMQGEIVTLSGIRRETYFVKEGSNNYAYGDIADFKPILRPLSDLTKEIEVNGEKFIPIERLRKEYSGFYFESNPELLIKSKNTNLYVSLNWTNEFQQKLYEWHFDIYGLIEQNLAIDKNTIL